MENKHLRGTEIYSRHFDCNETESHTAVSIKYAIEQIEDIILAAQSPGDLLASIQIKVNELKQLIAS
jgi:hypothetical protein